MIIFRKFGPDSISCVFKYWGDWSHSVGLLCRIYDMVKITMGKTVLIVDDAKFMRMMIKNILVSNGFEVAGEAENTAEAVAKYKELSPSLVTMDVVMPGDNGIEAVKQIIAYDPDAKIIMCSALGQQGLLVEAIEAGAKEFVIKPFKPARVLEAVNKVLH
ncbi:response regulator [Candidatus Lokiarchaeum ossiferum]